MAEIKPQQSPLNLVSGILTTVTGLVGSIGGIVASGPVGWIIAGVSVVGLGIGAWLLYRWWRGIRVKAANEATDENRNRVENEAHEEGRQNARENAGVIDGLIDMVNRILGK